MDILFSLEVLFGGLLVASLRIIWLLSKRLRQLRARLAALEQENAEAFRLLQRTDWLLFPDRKSA